MTVTLKAASLLLLCSVLPIASSSFSADADSAPIERLSIKGEDFLNARGETVRFWGVNLVALYPTQESAENLATNLSSLQINLVRPHHMLRQSKDWNPAMVSGALMTYDGNSRSADPFAWERFDGLNAALRKHGIYVALAVDWSRHYLPGDADILKTTPEDREAWMAAMRELNAWDWRKQFDVVKMLPVVDERAASIEEEFARILLTHVNPATGIAYGRDPQLLTLEVLNEATTEYAIVCGNKFPAYWQNKLLEKWGAFARQSHIEPGDLYDPKSWEQKQARADFMHKLDEDFFLRIKKVAREAGCEAPLIFTNLWRGDNALKWQCAVASHVEDHQYCDPLIAGAAADGFYAKNQTMLAGKPYFLGELNQAEGAANVEANSPFRTMLPLAASAYGAFNNWSGIEWFAWLHAARHLDANGWAADEARKASIGDIIADGAMIDHFRTAGLIFRRGLVAKSSAPITWFVDDPLWSADYAGLMRGKSAFKAGWHEIHAIRKSFGPVPGEQRVAPWMTTDPGPILKSDTGQIIKDTTRRQLTISAPQAEAFSGFLDGQTPDGPKHLRVSGKGFATVIAISLDGRELGASQRLVLSRTGIGEDKTKIDGPPVTLAGMQPTNAERHWYYRVTRPRRKNPTEPLRLETPADGQLVLPGGWHECELEWR